MSSGLVVGEAQGCGGPACVGHRLHASRCVEALAVARIAHAAESRSVHFDS